ncbi:c-type cytochrome [Pseudobdellovibrio exovorus]|uniref:Cytochrome c domain-containing protein n=1 Tax=Pseudobdellovibrio exovorus JSS TaxID=1184267 RepID=M4V6N5_9BACT|nr:c-type cytochrome [Pseudobdellovibrio exovorus]AGH94868.1 hypothetical protein A11Q_648 [Pseudobdellovibrio exovorus JSS]
MKTPIPHDIPLPLPAAEVFLKTLLVLSFIAHLLFVNLMVGGAIFALIYEIRGRGNKIYDELALFIAKTITVNKSMAVVLGVAPLLIINVLYTVWFYAANSLTGSVWMLVVPSVAVAFLLTYLHKYTWTILQQHKTIHISIIAIVVAIFLFIPLVFLTNINLMLFPEKWAAVKGFVSAMMLPSVFTRYLHFMAACISVTSLFLVWMFKYETFAKLESSLAENRSFFIRQFYVIALIVTALQFLIGPLVLISLPSHGLSMKMLVTIFSGVFIAVPAIWLMWKEVQETGTAGSRVIKIASLLGLTVLCMASGRHFYREQALSHHKKAVAEKTIAYQKLVKEAQEQAALQALVESGPLDESTLLERGKQLSHACFACHGLDTRLVGPPLKEIAKIYTGNPDGIVAWTKAPGKKRPDYPQMPPMPLPDAELKIIAEYILKIGQ